MKIVIVGCGDIGIRAARLLTKQGHHVIGVRRNVSALPDWIEAISADVSDRQSLAFLSQVSADVVIYSLAASGFNESAYQQAYVTGVANTLDALGSQAERLQRVIFVSSTSVYHQNDGSVVDEQSPTNPINFNGKLMLSGERLIAEYNNAGVNIGTVVRYSGIYGPARTRMIERVRKNIQSDPNDRSFTNRIHVDDCAAVMAHLVCLTEQNLIEPLYLASDSLPCTRYELESFIAQLIASEQTLIDGKPEFGCEKDGQSSAHTTVKSALTGVKKATRIAGSKRCSNHRLLDSGYEFIYPNYQAGYRHVLGRIES